MGVSSVSSAKLQGLEDQVRDTNRLLERERSETKTLHQAIYHMSRGTDVQELLQLQETQIVQMKQEAAQAGEQYRQALIAQEAKIMGELSAGDSSQSKEQLAQMLEQQWLQQKQRLARLEEDKQALAQVNDALLPQMEKMMMQTDELTHKLGAAEHRAARAEQELAAARKQLSAQAVHSAQGNDNLAASSALAAPAAAPSGAEVWQDPSAEGAGSSPGDPAQDATAWLASRGHGDVSASVMAALSENGLPPEEWVLNLEQIEQQGSLDTFLASILFDGNAHGGAGGGGGGGGSQSQWDAPVPVESGSSFATADLGGLGPSPSTRAPQLQLYQQQTTGAADFAAADGDSSTPSYTDVDQHDPYRSSRVLDQPPPAQAPLPMYGGTSSHVTSLLDGGGGGVGSYGHDVESSGASYSSYPYGGDTEPKRADPLAGPSDLSSYSSQWDDDYKPTQGSSGIMSSSGGGGVTAAAPPASTDYSGLNGGGGGGGGGSYGHGYTPAASTWETSAHTDDGLGPAPAAAVAAAPYSLYGSSSLKSYDSYSAAAGASGGIDAGAGGGGGSSAPIASDQLSKGAELLARSRQTRRRLSVTAQDISMVNGAAYSSSLSLVPDDGS